MSVKTIIFDFDGTIADTKSLYYLAIIDELGKFVSQKKIDEAINLGLSLRKTIRRLGFSYLYTFWLHRKIMKRIVSYVEKVKKCHDAEYVKKVKGQRILISNSLREFVMQILRHLKLKRYFDEIYCADDFNNKARFIKEYLRKRKIKKKNCFYIGDRMADVKLAREAGCLSVIVSGKCAWNSRQQILKEAPDFVISDLKELSEII